MSEIIKKIKSSIKGKNLKIVFPDGTEPNILKCGELLVKQKLLEPFFIGRRSIIEKICKENKISMEGFHIRDPYFDASTETFVNEYYNLRKHKGTSLDKAREIILKPSFFGAMLLKHGFVDGMVSGFNSDTKPFLPAFHIIGTKESQASSYFLMLKGTKQYLYSDCGLIIDPSEEELAEIAIQTSESAALYGIKPVVAMLSFSTKGSAKHPLVDKVRNATNIVIKKRPKLKIDGEVQFDAAIDVQISKKKNSSLGGSANVFIFPNLDAGNIAYKLTERLAGFKALGPLLQGLKNPVHDVSRGADVSDLVDIACIAAYEALKNGR